jgi:hypothetical protein
MSLDLATLPRLPPSPTLRVLIAQCIHEAASRADEIDALAHEADDAGLDAETVEMARAIVRSHRGLPPQARAQRGGQGNGNAGGNGRGGRP